MFLNPSRTLAGNALPPLLLGLALGVTISYLGVSAWRRLALSAGAVSQDTTAASSGARSGPPGSAGDAKPPAKEEFPPLGKDESIHEALRAAAARMTPEERLAEIERRLKSKVKFDIDAYLTSWAELHSSFLALMQPEDLERLKKMALEPQPATDGVGLPNVVTWSFQSALITRWAEWNEADLEKWITTYQEKPGEFLIPVSLYSLSNKWAKEDPFAGWNRMLRLMKDMPPSPMNTGGLQVLATASARRNPQLAFKQALALESASMRDQFAATALSEVAKKDFREALDLITPDLEPGWVQDLKNSVLRQYYWGSQDKERFAKIMEYLMTDDGENARAGMAASVMHTWNEKDHEAAAAWAEKNKEFLEPYQASSNLVKKPDPRKSVEESLAAAEALPEGPERDRGISDAYQKMMSRDPEEAFEKMAKMDPALAKNLIPNLIYTYAQNDPGYLAKNIEKLPEGFVRSNATNTLMRSWLELNEKAAITWAEAKPTGPIKDSAIESLMRYASEKDPAWAGAWALQSSNPAKRKSQLVQLAGSWKKKDAEGARRWIWQQASIPVETRTAFLEAIDKK